MKTKAKRNKISTKENKAYRKILRASSSQKSIKSTKTTEKKGTGMKEPKAIKVKAKKSKAKILSIPKHAVGRKSDKSPAKKGEKKSTGILKKSPPKTEIKTEEKTITQPVVKKSKLKKNELTQLKEELLNERNRLIKEIDTLDNITHTNGTEEIIEVRAYSIHMAENASEIEAVNTALGLRKILIERLDQINDALARIEEGNYGICVRCSCIINMERLLATPQAVLCVNCRRQEEAEKRGMMW